MIMACLVLYPLARWYGVVTTTCYIVNLLREAVWGAKGERQAVIGCAGAIRGHSPRLGRAMTRPSSGGAVCAVADAIGSLWLPLAQQPIRLCPRTAKLGGSEQGVFPLAGCCGASVRKWGAGGP